MKLHLSWFPKVSFSLRSHKRALKFKKSLNARWGKIPSCKSKLLTDTSQTNLNALIDFLAQWNENRVHIQRHNFTGCYIKVLPKEWSGLAASFIISIYFSSAHGVMTQSTRLVLRISLCLLLMFFWLFHHPRALISLCFHQCTQAKVQRNILKRYYYFELLAVSITAGFFSCSVEVCLADTFFRPVEHHRPENQFSLWLRKSMRWMSRESGESHWVPNHFLFLMPAL